MPPPAPLGCRAARTDAHSPSLQGHSTEAVDWRKARLSWHVMACVAMQGGQVTPCASCTVGFLQGNAAALAPHLQATPC